MNTQRQINREDLATFLDSLLMLTNWQTKLITEMKLSLSAASPAPESSRPPGGGKKARRKRK